jgi:hypothetical protein
MTVKVGDITINTENVLTYKFRERPPADASTILITAVGGEQFRLVGKKANALNDWLDDRSKTLDVESYDSGAVEYDGH